MRRLLQNASFITKWAPASAQGAVDHLMVLTMKKNTTNICVGYEFITMKKIMMLRMMMVVMIMVMMMMPIPTLMMVTMMMLKIIIMILIITMMRLVMMMISMNILMMNGWIRWGNYLHCHSIESLDSVTIAVCIKAINNKHVVSSHRLVSFHSVFSRRLISFNFV